MRFLFNELTLVALGLLRTIGAHTVFTNFFVDGVDQGNGTCVRMGNVMGQQTFPIASITGDDMACGVNGQAGVARVCPAKAGSTLTLEFHTDPAMIEPGVLDKYHRGPCAVYMKKVTSAVPPGASPAAGDGWFKIWYEDYDEATSTWCTEKLISDNGRLSVTIPTDIAGGYYLVRTELLALHQANLNPPNPQFFVGCAQLFLTPAGTAVPRSTVAIPGYVDLTQTAMKFNIWEKPMKLPYPEFGPPAYHSESNSTQMVSSGEQTEGLKPAGCILESANWCGFEVTSYTTQDGCWNASNSCWAQSKVCWSSTGPTGIQNCRIWDAKCTEIGDACKAGNYNGPPDAGKIRTPALRALDLPKQDSSCPASPIQARKLRHARRLAIRLGHRSI